MPISHERAQQRGRIGGLARAALTEDPKSLTVAARAARWQRYVDQVKAALPQLTDEADIQARAELLRRADMTRMALKSSVVRSRKAAARRKAQLIVMAAELDATGLLDCGSDGVDADAR